MDHAPLLLLLLTIDEVGRPHRSTETTTTTSRTSKTEGVGRGACAWDVGVWWRLYSYMG
jgi:hypothetical protein